ncbi:hypothetical protein [Raoultibacter phocaeensis]|uniref:hypothetical protein n=1 Tax=Raoultibacter phocaeensis TaxID=2479841 RepID=UPI0011189394|nr:hypothetical protein [Raoultibacter phocaeensis]
MANQGAVEAVKMLSMDDDVERQRAAEELERMAENIKFEAEASVEEADEQGDEAASVEAAETAMKAEEIREANEQEFTEEDVL